jgi:cysteine desulfurase / selenocysteine lyase
MLNLFASSIFEAVDTKQCGQVAYANFDHAATTPPFRVVDEGIQQFLSGYGSVHRGSGLKSIRSTDVYESAREQILHSVNAPTDSYALFVNNTTAAMNMIAAFFAQIEGKIAVSSLEHSSSMLPFIVAEGKAGLGRVSMADLPRQNEIIQQRGQKQVVVYHLGIDGSIDLLGLDNLLSVQSIKAVVLTATSNLTGAIPPIRAISDIVHKRGGLVILDACQYIQHHRVDMQALGVDFVAASGHKFYAPYGGGFLVGSKGFFDSVLPYQIGGGNLPYITADGEFLRYKNVQAHDPGTPNAVGAVAMAIALKEIDRIGYTAIAQYEKGLVNALYNGLCDVDGLTLFARDFPSTSTPFAIDGLDPADVGRILNADYGIGIRAGSFCVYNAIRQLLSISKEEDARIANEVRTGNTNAIPKIARASMGLSTSLSDVDRLVSAIKQIAQIAQKRRK